MNFEADTFLQSWYLEGRWFEPLQGIPAFKALKAKNLTRVNEERTKLGFAVLSD